MAIAGARIPCDRSPGRVREYGVYKGASNEVIETRVTELVEGSVAGIEGIRQITSQSRNERSSVTIEFVVGRDPDAAAADVRDRVARIMARLPDGVDPPVV